MQSRPTLLCFLTLVVLVARMGLVGSAFADGHEAQRSVHGQAEFMQYCSPCHGADGKGGGPVAASLKVPPPDLTNLAERYGSPLSRAKLAEFIDGRRRVGAHGPGDMPVWGEKFFGDVPNRVPETERRTKVDVVVRYLMSIQEEK